MMARAPYKTTIEDLNGLLLCIEQDSQFDNVLLVKIDDSQGTSMEVALRKNSVLRLFSEFANDLADELDEKERQITALISTQVTRCGILGGARPPDLKKE